MKRLLNQLLGLFPSRLPTGVSAFDKWVDSIIETYPMPTMNRDSIVNGLAATIMRLGPTAAYRPKVYFALIIQAGAAKQVAGYKFSELRQKQIDAEKTATKQPVEVTTPPTQSEAVTSDALPTKN